MKKQFNLLLIFFILILFFYTRKFTERFSNEINVPVFVINLEKDKDRMDLFRKNIYPIFKNNVSRIEGVKHKIGMIGCRLAHTKANISAINKGHPYYIICEDDILPLLDKGEINGIGSYEFLLKNNPIFNQLVKVKDNDSLSS